MEQTDFEEPEENMDEPQDEWPWNVTITPPPEFGQDELSDTRGDSW